jgi:hypothetical protein
MVHAEERVDGNGTGKTGQSKPGQTLGYQISPCSHVPRGFDGTCTMDRGITLGGVQRGYLRRGAVNLWPPAQQWHTAIEMTLWLLCSVLRRLHASCGAFP